MHLKSTLAALSLTLAAACATQNAPKVPTLQFSPTQVCTTAPNLSLSKPLTSEKPTGQLLVMTPFSAGTACLVHDDGSEGPYQLFTMPTALNAVSVNVGSVLDGLVVPLNVETLNANGETVRSYAMNDMVRRGKSKSVLLRPLDEEVYILTQVDTSLLGEAYQVALNSTEFIRPYSYFGRTFAKVYFSEPES